MYCFLNTKKLVQLITFMIGAFLMSILDPPEESLVFPADLPPANYSEMKVPKFEIPNPFIANDHSLVQSIEQWETSRRNEILHLFEDHFYGRVPKEIMDDSNLAVVSRITEMDEKAFDGKATRIQMQFGLVPEGAEADNATLDIRGFAVNVLIYIPNKVEGPVPAFLGYNFKGNHTICEDPGILLSLHWTRKGEKFERVRAQDSERGSAKSRWPVEKILDAGFALMTAHYCDVVPDFPEGRKEGIQGFFDEKEMTESEGNDWGAITAWAWGLSTICSLAAVDDSANRIDWKRVIVFGHSRLGKTALWAGALDERFAAVISNDSGCGGAALTRREFGETLYRMNTVFPHWLCGKSKEYNRKVNELPVDQHLLIALIAPRPLYVASAAEDLWADPKGEFLSCFYADPVYRFLRSPGLGANRDWPPVDEPVGETVRYHVRTGKHDITEYDWDQYLKFATELVK